MLVFRSFAIGLLAACFALLVIRPRIEVRHVVPPTLPFERMPSMHGGDIALAPTIIDAAPGITHAQIADTILLSPGERISAIGDVQVASDLSAGTLLALRRIRSGEFIDVTVAGPAGERRVLVLQH